jgi:hypothetical protein
MEKSVSKRGTSQAIVAEKALVLAAEAQQYELTCVNNGNQNWNFYVYQTVPNQEVANMFSLAWLVSSYQMRPGNTFRFQWSQNYSFVWNASGELKPGVSFFASGQQSCSPSSNNSTTFDVNPAPGFDPSSQATPSGTLIIKDSPRVPPKRFSVGIAMSGSGTFVQQAGPSLTHHYTPTPTFWVAAGVDTKVGDVLDMQTITQSGKVQFPPNVYALTATLNPNNTWSVS